MTLSFSKTRNQLCELSETTLGVRSERLETSITQRHRRTRESPEKSAKDTIRTLKTSWLEGETESGRTDIARCKKGSR